MLAGVPTPLRRFLHVSNMAFFDGANICCPNVWILLSAQIAHCIVADMSTLQWNALKILSVEYMSMQFGAHSWSLCLVKKALIV